MQKPSINVILILLVFGGIEFFDPKMGRQIFLAFAAILLLADQIVQLWGRVKRLEAEQEESEKQ